MHFKRFYYRIAFLKKGIVSGQELMQTSDFTFEIRSKLFFIIEQYKKSEKKKELY